MLYWVVIIMDNSLKSIISSGLANMSEIFSADKSTKSVLGVDIGSSAIKVVQLKKKNGKAVLETYGAISLGPYGNTDIGQVTNLQVDDIVRALVDVMKESNVTVKNGVISIPSSSSLIFTISLPDKITEDKFQSVIPIEARKYIPVPISEVTLDWFVLPKDIDSSESNIMDSKTSQPILDTKTEVLVVAIHNDILNRYQEILKKTELHSESFEMEIFSNIRSSFSHDLAPVLLIDFGASKTKLSIIEEGVVHVFHVVNRGGCDITKNISASLGVSFVEAEKLKREVGLDVNSNPEVADIIRLSIEYILADANSVVFAYQKKYNKNISKVILTGGGSLTKGLKDKSISNFNTEVVYSNPFAKTEAPAFLEPILEISGPEFSVAVGLALRQLF